MVGLSARTVAVGVAWLAVQGLECFLDAAGGGGLDAPVDGEGLLEEGRGVGGVPVVEVASAGSFEGPGLCEGGSLRRARSLVPGRGIAGCRGLR